MAGSGAGLLPGHPVPGRADLDVGARLRTRHTRARTSARLWSRRPCALAAAGDEPPSGRRRLFAVTHLLLPWLVLYYGVEALARAARRRRGLASAGTPRCPVLPWTEAAVRPLTPPARDPPPRSSRPTRRALRTFITRGWIAMACHHPPVAAHPPSSPRRKRCPADGVLARLMTWQPAWDPAGDRIPRLPRHVGRGLPPSVYAKRWPRGAWAGRLLTVGFALRA